MGRQRVALTARGLSPPTIKAICGTSCGGWNGMREPPPSLLLGCAVSPFPCKVGFVLVPPLAPVGCTTLRKGGCATSLLPPTLLPCIPRDDPLCFTEGVMGRRRPCAVRAARCLPSRTSSPSLESQVEQLNRESDVRRRGSGVARSPLFAEWYNPKALVELGGRLQLGEEKGERRNLVAVVGCAHAGDRSGDKGAAAPPPPHPRIPPRL